MMSSTDASSGRRSIISMTFCLTVDCTMELLVVNSRPEDHAYQL
jgi:hypothetical protein